MEIPVRLHLDEQKLPMAKPRLKQKSSCQFIKVLFNIEDTVSLMSESVAVELAETLMQRTDVGTSLPMAGVVPSFTMTRL